MLLLPKCPDPHAWWEVVLCLKILLLEPAIIGLHSSWRDVQDAIIYPLFWNGGAGIAQITGDLIFF